MGKVTGFLDFERIENKSIAPKTRVKNFKEFVIPFSSNVLNQQASRCMNCGILYCHSSCPVNNIIPEWNELVCEETGEKILDTSFDKQFRFRTYLPCSSELHVH